MRKQSSLKVTGLKGPALATGHDTDHAVPTGAQLHPLSSESSVSSVQSEIGWDSRSAVEAKGRRLGGGLSQADRELIKWQRLPAGEDDEKEMRPLPGLQKVVQHGAALEATGNFDSPNFDGLCLAINPNNDTVAVGCRYSKVLLLDLETLRYQTAYDLSGNKKDAAITAVRYRPDGHGGTSNVAYMAQESNILTVHVSRGHVLNRREEPGNSVNALAVRQSGAPMLAAAGKDAVVRVYDETTGKQAATLDHGDDVTCCGHSNTLHAVNWKPDDPNVLVSGGWDRCVNIWDLRLGRAVRSVSGPYICGGDNLDIRGEELVTGSWRHDKPLQLWDVGTGRLLTNCPFYQPELDACMLYAAKFAPGPEDLIIAGGSGKRPCVKAFQTNGQVLGTLAVPSGVNAMASSSTWSEKERSVVLCCADRVLLMKI